MYICLCHGVTDRDIRACIEEGAGSMRELRAKLAVGTQCGKCACHVRGILEEKTSAKGDSARSVPGGALA